MSRSYYAILGVPRNATARQIRQRFLALARERHPDRFSGDEKADAEVEFQLVTEAFNTLNDIDRRREHDQMLQQLVDTNESNTRQVAKVYIQRARQAWKDGSKSDAIQNFERATREDPEYDTGWYLLARHLGEDRRSLPRARLAIGKACELQPMEAKYRVLAGDLYAASGMIPEAEESYQKALDWGGSDPDVDRRLTDLQKGERGGLFGRR